MCVCVYGVGVSVACVKQKLNQRSNGQGNKRQSGGEESSPWTGTGRQAFILGRVHPGPGAHQSSNLP